MNTTSSLPNSWINQGYLKPQPKYHSFGRKHGDAFESLCSVDVLASFKNLSRDTVQLFFSVKYQSIKRASGSNKISTEQKGDYVNSIVQDLFDKKLLSGLSRDKFCKNVTSLKRAFRDIADAVYVHQTCKKIVEEFKAQYPSIGTTSSNSVTEFFLMRLRDVSYRETRPYVEGLIDQLLESRDIHSAVASQLKNKRYLTLKSALEDISKAIVSGTFSDPIFQFDYTPPPLVGFPVNPSGDLPNVFLEQGQDLFTKEVPFAYIFPSRDSMLLSSALDRFYVYKSQSKHLKPNKSFGGRVLSAKTFEDKVVTLVRGGVVYVHSQNNSRYLKPLNASCIQPIEMKLGSVIAVGTKDGQVRLFNLKNEELGELRHSDSPSSEVTSVLQLDSGSILIGDSAGRLTRWLKHGDGFIRDYDGHVEGGVNEIVKLPNNHVGVVLSNGMMSIFNADSSELSYTNHIVNLSYDKLKMSYVAQLKNGLITVASGQGDQSVLQVLDFNMGGSLMHPVCRQVITGLGEISHIQELEGEALITFSAFDRRLKYLGYISTEGL